MVVDETGALSPGPLTGLDVSLHRALPVFRAEAPAERDHPFGFGDPIVPLAQAVAKPPPPPRGTGCSWSATCSAWTWPACRGA